MMSRIIRATEMFHERSPAIRRRERGLDTTLAAVADAGCQIAHHLQAHAIVAFTRSDKTAILAAQRRPDRPIVAFTTRPEVRNRLALTWGVHPYLLEPINDTEELIRTLDEIMLRDGLASAGDQLVLLLGAPIQKLGPTNMTMVYTVGTWAPIEGT